MTRIAIIGANGRLGSELALRLLSTPDVGVSAICRNRAGSAFLRRNGVECRHGDVADLASAHDLLGDADLVVNLAYGFAKSANGHRANRANVLASLVGANTSARVILASTIMVYGPAYPLRFPDAYGIEKLRLERYFLTNARRMNRPAHVFRIGHALGDLQPLTRQIGDEIRSGHASARMDSSRPSNAIHVASLAEALLALDGEQRQVLDLFNAPLITWGDIYREQAGLLRSGPLEMLPVASPLSAAGLIREAALAVNQLLPARLTEPAFGRLLIRRAKRDLAATASSPSGRSGIQATRWRALTPHQPLNDLSRLDAVVPAFPLPPDLET